MAGRPKTEVPQKVADQVIAWIAEGKTLREFCRQAEMPHFSTVYDWIEKNSEFALRFARAREQGEDVIAQECLEIADDGTNDWEERQNKDGTTYDVVNPEVVQRSKLRIDTRLKLLAKWNPKKYGEKLLQEHTGKVQIESVLIPERIATKPSATVTEPNFGNV